MQSQEKEEGISLGEIFRIIGKTVWLLLGISCLIALALTLAVGFLINPALTSYSLEFSLVYPASDTLKYPDGTPFSYREMISLSSLQAVVDGNGSFSDVNVRKMVEEDDVSIEAETQTGDGSTVYTGVYTITVRGSYFKNRTQATSFLRAVAEAPVYRARELASAIDYLLDEEVFSAASFSDQLSLLAEQKQSLLDQYDEWISLFRSSYTVGGKTLNNYRTEVSVLFGEEVQDRLAGELEMYGYVSVDQLEATRSELKAEKLVNESKMEALRALLSQYYGTGVQTYAAVTGASESTVVVDGGGSSVLVMLAELEMRNVEIDVALDMLTEENVTAFGEEVMAEYEGLKSAANTVSAVATAIYEQESAAVYSTARAEESGGVSLALVAVAVFIVAFCAGAAILVCKRRSAARAASEQEGAGGT